jgi:hypothetical protein
MKRNDIGKRIKHCTIDVTDNEMNVHNSQKRNVILKKDTKKER